MTDLAFWRQHFRPDTISKNQHCELVLLRTLNHTFINRSCKLVYISESCKTDQQPPTPLPTPPPPPPGLIMQHCCHTQSSPSINSSFPGEMSERASTQSPTSSPDKPKRKRLMQRPHKSSPDIQKRKSKAQRTQKDNHQTNQATAPTKTTWFGNKLHPTLTSKEGFRVFMKPDAKGAKGVCCYDSADACEHNNGGYVHHYDIISD